MQINCLIVDDEPEAQLVIQSYLDRLDGFTVLGSASNAVEAFQLLQENSVDLMFLDIKLPKINGIDFLRSLSSPPKVILTTAYREFALDGYELDVIDFLLKPISMERFLKSISKIYTINNLEQIELPREPTVHAERPFIYVKSERKMVKIFLDEISYIESIRDYVKIILSNKNIVSKQRISFLEKILPEKRFIRIHRSYIISLPKVEAFTPTTIEIDGNELPIGNHYKNSILKALKIQ